MTFVKLWWSQSFPFSLCINNSSNPEGTIRILIPHPPLCVQITEDPEVKHPLKVCRVLRLLILALPNSMPAPPPLTTVAAVM